MYFMHYDDFNSSMTMSFIKKRLIRVVPLYWFYSLIFLLLLWLLPKAFGHATIGSIAWVFGSLLFVPVLNSDGNIAPILNVGWTLNYEMFFYFFFGLSLVFKKRYMWILGVIFIGFTIFDYKNFYLDYYSNSIILEFALGIFIAHIYKKDICISSFYLILLMSLSVLLISSNMFIELEYSRVILYGLTFSLLLFTFIHLEKVYTFNNKYLIQLGNISYSLYLSHIFTISIVFKLIGNLPLAIIISLIMSIVVASFSFKYVEQPIHRYLRRKT